MTVVATTRPLYATNPGAALVFWATVSVWVAAELRRSGQTRADASAHDSGSRVVVRLSILAGWVIAVLAGNHFRGPAMGGDRVLTFGAGITLPLYAVGGLTVLLQRVIAERKVASWSAGE